MSSKRLLTIIGSTGQQGGSILDIFLARPDIQDKYALRGVTRDPSSGKSKALIAKGIEMVKADLDNVDSLKAAFSGSYGVFGVTDFWAVMSKDIEVQQGKNIFEASKAAGVEHLVFSSLYSAAKLSGGRYTHVDHFDGKADVHEYIEANKGSMIASYFMPAMFLSYIKNQTKAINGTPTLSLPFPTDDVAWPLLEPRPDSGKYVMGLFEGGEKANGVSVQAPSFWTTPKDLMATLSKASGREVVFKTIPADVFASYLPKSVSAEITEMMQFIGNFSYYGKGSEKAQGDSDKWLLPDEKTMTLEEWAEANGPWNF